MVVKFSRYASAQFVSLTDAQRDQARRLVRAIILAETHVGRPWNRDNQNRLHWIASALDTHLIYRIAFRRIENTLYVTAVLTFPIPPDPNNP